MPSVRCETCQEVQTIRDVDHAVCRSCGSTILTSVEGYEGHPTVGR